MASFLYIVLFLLIQTVLHFESHLLMLYAISKTSYNSITYLQSYIILIIVHNLLFRVESSYKMNPYNAHMLEPSRLCLRKVHLIVAQFVAQLVRIMRRSFSGLIGQFLNGTCYFWDRSSQFWTSSQNWRIPFKNWPIRQSVRVSGKRPNVSKLVVFSRASRLLYFLVS